MSDILIIDKDLRTITIPDTVTMLGVESDDDVYRLNFQMPKTYGEYDLSTFSARINYVNAKAEGDVYVVDDMEVDGDDITFTWLVGRNACEYKGDTYFNVCLKKIDEGVVVQEFNTQPVSLPVLEGLETTEAVIQQNPDIIEYILNLLNNMNPSGITDYLVKIDYSETQVLNTSITKTYNVIQNLNGVQSVIGIVETLYLNTGSNTDGAMTQKATTEAINNSMFLPVQNYPTAPIMGTEVSFSIYPNVLNTIGSDLSDWTDITIDSLVGSQSNKLNRYYLRINTGVASPTLTLPPTVTIPSFTLEAGKIYDIVIQNNIASVWCDGAAISDPIGYVTPEMYGAKGDGVTDDTDAMQAMFDYISNNIANKPVLCVGGGKYLTGTITVTTPTYDYSNIALLSEINFICKDEYLFTGLTNNHYGFVFDGCRFEVASGVTSGKVYSSYLFTMTKFNSCYFKGFKNVVYGSTFIQSVEFANCKFEDCETVFYATGVFTLKAINCVFENCDHVFEQALLDSNVQQQYRTVSMLQINGCYINKYTDYAVKAFSFQNIFIEKNYFEEGAGTGHGIVVETNSDFTNDNCILEIKDNKFQMAVSGNVSPKLFVGVGDIACVNVSDNLSYDAVLADIQSLTVTKEMNFVRNVRRLNSSDTMIASYATLKNVYAPDFNKPLVNYGQINGVMYQVEIIKGKIIFSRIVNATIAKGAIYEATFNFSGFTNLDVSNIEPYSYYRYAKELSCYNDSGSIKIQVMGLSDSFVAADNRVAIMLN